MTGFLTATATAEMGSGTYSVGFQGAAGLYDISGTYHEYLDGIDLDYTLNMDEAGKFSGQGTASISGRYGGVSMYINMDLDFSGSIKTAGSVTRVIMNMKMKGAGTAAGYGVTFSASMKEDMEVNALSRRMIGTITGRVTAAIPSMHKKQSARVRDEIEVDLPYGVTGEWNLTMSVTPADKKYVGGAKATLSNGRTVPLVLKGSYAEKTGISKLSLKGEGLNKSASVSMLATFSQSEATCRTLTGKMLGQKVRYYGIP